MTILKNKTVLFGVCVIGLAAFWRGPSLRAATMDSDKDSEVTTATAVSDEDDQTGDLMDQDDAQIAKDKADHLGEVTFNYFLTSGYATTIFPAFPRSAK